ncbi:superfamily II RNA helicase [Mycolicibacterium phlei]|uniref:DEAD/DEAH box helicase n=1 Tax=Mycolicibacterium phlei DSM 43239 = CCUG 21000 TaxID=1226750 RepID=A0A5N5UYL6_MYCPH|nr:DEAD/DEAH box helicase [Mycolicibacterium phlei]VEG11969.1 superfamily II RNA helicase [Mycobacteroides chelonae]AMO63880.1 ski2-like helicase [Mycolicibacterium phlei]KAB7754732.1 DEAD/DEAH box helicase [Mycolicibacterium phlei DSM 43239 = CCUG 21000]KXW65377.1 DEAD/DEAH box helicase [Mycolicibacterium phlei DSM 43239 = CCUG 21000]KXW70601.1 DEAD/DEAH box helicase [Mycolicibacterium phlei DSM 43070]
MISVRELLSAENLRDADPDDLFTAFAEWAEANGTTLYPAQEEALIELVSGANVILSTPTGSGKSLVATGALFAALAGGRRSFYTAPIKALVSEKFFAMCDVFGAANVGMLTGDAAVNSEAPIIVCTAEVLANVALREGGLQGPLGGEPVMVVMDEFHFYGDPDRGWAWQVPLLELPKAQFLLMSATLGDVTFLREDLTRRTGRPTALVANAERPVPLFFSYATTPMHETIGDLLDTRQAPIYVVHFTQASALERAQALMSVNVCTKEEKAAIAEHIGAFRFSTSFGSTLSRLVRHGIGVHHAGMLPKYRRLVEQLAQAGLLKVICGTDTLGVGINVPIRTVVFSALSKYDGVRTRLLNAREFHQIAGRAGRAGFDTAGTVVVQAPDHEVENLKQFAKVADDPKKRRKLVRRKAPEGMVPWSESTMKRLVDASPEPLVSNMRVSTAMILDVVARPGDPFAAMRRLLTDNHEPRKRQLRHIREAVGIARSLLQAGVIERLPEPEPDGRRYRLTVDLPPNFALYQPLSTFALAAVEVLDPESDTFALDVVSVIEATLEDPRQILAAQLSKARGEAVAAMKAEGIEYEERIELLDEVTYPKPLDELLTHTFEVYLRSNPWAADGHLSPKSVVREMWERAMTFREYVSHYGLTRSEGAVLRYLSDAYKALRSGVPAAARTEELADIVEWLGELVRQVDSSLLDEWEQLTSPDQPHDVPVAVPAKPRPLTGNERAFTAMVRNALFRRVELFARQRWAELGELDRGSGWNAQRWAEVGEEYFAEHADVGTGPDARGPAMLIIERESDVWRVRQILDDPAGDHDWGFTVEVDLAASDEEGAAVLRVVDAGRLD